MLIAILLPAKLSAFFFTIHQYRKRGQEEHGDDRFANMELPPLGSNSRVTAEDAQPDDTLILWNHKGYSSLHGSINCTDNIGLDLRIPAGSCVRLNLSIRLKYTRSDDSKAILDRAV